MPDSTTTTTTADLDDAVARECTKIEPPLQKTKVLPFVLALFLAAGAYGLWTVAVNETKVPVPTELIGYWRSSTEQYDDRYLYFADRSVALGRGDFAESQGFPVESVQSTIEGTERHLSVVYRQPDGTRDQLHLVYHVPTKTLTFKNQPSLKWTKRRSKG